MSEQRRLSFQTADDLAVVHGGLRHKGGVGVQDGNPFQPPSGWNVAPTKGPTKQIKVGVAESRQSAVTDQLQHTQARISWGSTGLKQEPRWLTLPGRSLVCAALSRVTQPKPVSLSAVQDPRSAC